MKKLGVLGAWLFLLCNSLTANGEVECIEQPNGKEPLCFELGGSNNPTKPIVIKPGKGCGTNSACGGNMRVVPDISMTESEASNPAKIELAPKFGNKQGANPSLQGTLRDKATQRP